MANPIRTAAVPLRKALRGIAIRCGRRYNARLGFGTLYLRLNSHMIRVAILGASGYSALELMKLLLRHPEVEITALTTRQTEARRVGEVHPSLAGRLDLAAGKSFAEPSRGAGRLRVLLLAAWGERGGRRRAACRAARR